MNCFPVFPQKVVLNRIVAVWLLAVLGLGGCANSAPSSRYGGSVGDGYYRVQRGDNLYRIGLRYGQTVTTLQHLNGLSNPDAIEVGQIIRVRGRAAQVTRRPPTPAKHHNTGVSVAVPATTATPNVSLQWPVRGPILSTYNGTTQKGIDIGGSRGTPIKAAAAGTVLYAGAELRGYGKLVLLKHSNSTMTAYAHNDTLAVHKGQSVTAGQVIAGMGDSGTQGIKLHFEVRVNSKAVNPTHYLP